MCAVVQTSMKEEKEDGLMEDAVLYQVYGEAICGWGGNVLYRIDSPVRPSMAAIDTAVQPDHLLQKNFL